MPTKTWFLLIALGRDGAILMCSPKCWQNGKSIKKLPSRRLYSFPFFAARRSVHLTMAIPTEDTEHILEAAFEQAFSPPPSRRQSVIPTAKASAPEDIAPVSESSPVSFEEAVAAAITESTPAPGEEETWKQEYEDQVKAWRAQSAEAREKAEKVREQWEAKRAAEREEAEKRKAAGIPEPEPEVIPGPPNELVAASEVSESTVLVPSESEEQAQEQQAEVKTEESTVVVSETSEEPQPHVAASTVSHADTIDGSQKWEEVDSNTSSSYPSMSFPEQSTPPLEHKEPRSRHQQSHHEPVPAPSTATLSVFDSSLSTRTRVKALASSLAINLFLPFVNGVMLGFGEIFAKHYVLGWIGWGSTATSVGVQQRSRFGARR
ncbi:hypothetical protein NP233_g7427 [Leucocoprinus birnbaumii]|uniref:Uncharacterized protein n=1 Tax=Leucocoprinus birnbaumii TaxID=56174 RepID=A0AAD5VQ83_9AGAR|nr:hypothetical protein NP233_g7427 [Leucocoprinus birnbaumii]